MLNEGFSKFASISEKIDNALDAGATEMIIHTNTTTHMLAFSDNGAGMTEAQAKDAHRINNRKEKTASKHGCFGRGGAQSTIYLTNLETTSVCISLIDEKRLAGADPLAVEINWQECIAKNEYDPRPQREAGKSHMELWRQFAVNPNGSGTVFYIPCAYAQYKTIVDAIKTRNIVESLTFWLGRTYYNALTAGFKLTIKVDGIAQAILPVNPLYPEYTVKKHRASTSIDVYKSADRKETRAYYKKDGSLGYIDFSSSKKGKWLKEAPTEGWAKVGEICVESLYLPQDALRHITRTYADKYDIIHTSEERWDQTSRKYLYGIYYERNGKVVSRMDVPATESGDRDKYTFKDDTCHRVAFSADLDDYFDIQVNKSRIDVGNFDKVIAETISRVRKDFSAQIAKAAPAPVAPAPVAPAPVALAAPVAAQVVSHGHRPKLTLAGKISPKLADIKEGVKAPAATTAPAPAATSVAAPAAAPAVAPAAAPAATPAVAPAAAPAVAPAATPVAAPAAIPAAIPAATPAVAPAVVPVSPSLATSYTQIPAHKRTTSKSKHDLWIATANLNDILRKINISAKLKEASTETEPGNAEVYKAIETIMNFINGP